jgi:p-cymene methyl-monooxygenase electron transfer component
VVFGFLKRGSKEPGVVRIEPLGIEVAVPGNQSVLQAALEAGVDFPHSCKVGTCTSCRSKLLEGEVKAIRDFSYVLSAEELKAGYILACQAKVRAGERVRLEVELDTHRPHFQAARYAGRIAVLTELTHDIRLLRIMLDRPLAYAAGQYVSLRPKHLERARDYSFATAPGAGGSHELTFYVRLTPGGAFTEWLFREARAGDALEVEGPHGDFWLRPDEAPLLFVAGGSGLAPIRAILEEALHAGVARDAVFLFGARAQRDLYDLERVADVAARWQGNFRFVPVLSEEPPDSDWGGARGLVTSLITPAAITALADRHAYLCGPPRMIDAALEALARAGVPDRHVHYDKFLDASTLPPP